MENLGFYIFPLVVGLTVSLKFRLKGEELDINNWLIFQLQKSNDYKLRRFQKASMRGSFIVHEQTTYVNC